MRGSKTQQTTLFSLRTPGDRVPEDHPLRRVTLGADKGYDTKDLIEDCRQLDVTPHVARTSDARRRSAIDRRTTHWPGYDVSQRIRKRIEYA